MYNIQNLLDEREPKVGNILFIAVDGHGGSGKSTLAEFLSKNLSATIIRTDDFASWENPLNWYIDVVEKVFRPITEGAAVLHHQPTSWYENHRPEPVTKLVTPTMILEGVSSSRSEFRDYISITIFVDTPLDVCLSRGVERDLQSGTGKSEEELIKMWQEWLEEEKKYMECDNPKEYADIVLDGTKPFEDQIEFQK